MTWRNIWNTSKGILTTIMGVLTTVAVILTIIWAGWKGMIGFFLGMAMMAYLVLSENPLLLAIMERASGPVENEEGKDD